MKKLAFMFAVAATMLTVACSKEDSTNNSNQGNSDGNFVTAKTNLTYSISLEAASAESLNKGYDAVIDYYDSDGTIRTSSALTANNLTWEFNVTRTSFPAEVGFRVRFVPKSDLGGVAEGDKFNLRGPIKISGTCTSTSGKTRQLMDSIYVQKNGITPLNGHTYKETLRKTVSTEGTWETGSWPE